MNINESLEYLADSLPKYTRKFEGETFEPEFILAYTFDGFWEIEYMAMEPEKNFTVRSQSLVNVLKAATEKVTITTEGE